MSWADVEGVVDVSIYHHYLFPAIFGSALAIDLLDRWEREKGRERIGGRGRRKESGWEEGGRAQRKEGWREGEERRRETEGEKGRREGKEGEKPGVKCTSTESSDSPMVFWWGYSACNANVPHIVQRGGREKKDNLQQSLHKATVHNRQCLQRGGVGGCL